MQRQSIVEDDYDNASTIVNNDDNDEDNNLSNDAIQFSKIVQTRQRECISRTINISKPDRSILKLLYQKFEHTQSILHQVHNNTDMLGVRGAIRYYFTHQLSFSFSCGELENEYVGFHHGPLNTRVKLLVMLMLYILYSIIVLVNDLYTPEQYTRPVVFIDICVTLSLLFIILSLLMIFLVSEQLFRLFVRFQLRSDNYYTHMDDDETFVNHPHHPSHINNNEESYTEQIQISKLRIQYQAMENVILESIVQLALGILTVSSLGKSAFQWIYTNEVPIAIFELIILAQFLTKCRFNSAVHIVNGITLVITICTYVIVCIQFRNYAGEIVLFVLLQILFVVFSSFYIAFIEVTNRKLFLMNKKDELCQSKISLEESRYQKILLQLLPVTMAQKIMYAKKNNITISRMSLMEEYEYGSVLIADIDNFSSFAIYAQPKDLLRLLMIQFAEFDKLCKYYRCEKIKTCADHYICVCTRDKSNEIILEFAQSMLEVMNTLEKQFHFSHKVRISIASGNMNLCIIGNQYITLEVFGRAAMLAGDMLKRATAGRIQVSEDVVQKTNHRYQFSPHSKILCRVECMEVQTFLFEGQNMEEELSEFIRNKEQALMDVSTTGTASSPSASSLSSSIPPLLRFVSSSTPDHQTTTTLDSTSSRIEDLESNPSYAFNFTQYSNSNNNNSSPPGSSDLSIMFSLLIFKWKNIQEELNFIYKTIEYATVPVHFVNYAVLVGEIFAILVFIKFYTHRSTAATFIVFYTCAICRCILLGVTLLLQRKRPIVTSIYSFISLFITVVFALSVRLDTEVSFKFHIPVMLGALVHFHFILLVPWILKVVLSAIWIIIVISFDNVAGNGILSLYMKGTFLLTLLFCSLASLQMELPFRTILKTQITNSIHQEEVTKDEKSNDVLLSSIIPPVLVNQLRQDLTQYTHDVYKDGSVCLFSLGGLFEELHNRYFSSIASTDLMNEYITLVDTIFTTFDTIINNTSSSSSSSRGGCCVRKVKSSDCIYICMASSDSEDGDEENKHAIQLASTAIQLRQTALDIIHQQCQQQQQDHVIRIAMTSGRFFGGILGLHKFSYDILGKAVFRANHLLMSCEPGKIQINTTMNERIHDHFHTEMRQDCRSWWLITDKHQCSNE
jgi:class 3 adenylate cyclase